MIFIPERDGIDHINVYSKGATELGRLLTNFAHTPFEHPVRGRFESMEGYWYYVATGEQHEELRHVHGAQAKALGKTFEKVERENFEVAIRTGIRSKLIHNPKILCMLLDNELPLAHYYVFGSRVKHAGYEWINEYYMEIRESCLIRGYRPATA
ncbi:hypothetical protein ISREJYDI_CDS0173 [Pseudomonas phage UNO-G1W1]|uniref:Uncharacterized protein n=1 Tax=Pseudomonas phage UNO-G1W1 TaxID=3136609 RepID=A0AAX4MV84_9CAUD